MLLFAVPSLLVCRCRFVDILHEWAQTNQQLKEFARYTHVMRVCDERVTRVCDEHVMRACDKSM